MRHDLLKYKVAYVDTRSGVTLFSVITKPSDNNTILIRWVERYHRYLLSRPYTRLVISPLVSIETGELFNPKIK